MSDTASPRFFENPLFKSLERIFQAKAPELSCVTAGYGDVNAFSSEWSDGESKVVVQFARLASPEEAAFHLQAFAWHIPLTGAHHEEVQRDPEHFQLPQPVMPNTRLPNLGDENYVWTRYDERGSSLIKFRAGALFVQVDGTSLVVVERLARIVAEHMGSA